MTRTDDHRPAVARLRRTRWLLTALFTAITAGCLVALGTFAVTIDANSRQRALDGEVDRVVTGLAREIYRDDQGALVVVDVYEDDLAHGSTAVVVIANEPGGQWQQRFEHLRPALPGDDALSRLADDVAYNEDTIVRSSTDTRGKPVRLAAAPIWEGDEVTAVVVAGADPEDSARDHRRLVWALALACTALVALAAAAGHLLSGRSLRPAAQMLDEQERFLTDAAHELRTPLATLRLVTDAGLRTPADAGRALEDAQGIADRMARLVTGLLARARTRTGVTAPEMVPLRLDQLVESVVEEFADRHITLTASPTIVAGDPDLLELAVRNVLDNALRHGAVDDEDPRVEVTVGDGRVEVRDHGPGLNPDLTTDPFERGVAGPSGNHGFGLAIVRWVAQLHSGSATIGAAPGGGTTVTIALPVVPGEKAP